MGSSDYSAMARPYVVNLDVVGPLSVYVQVGFVRARLACHNYTFGGCFRVILRS